MEKDHRKEKGCGLAVSKEEFEKLKRIDKAYNNARQILKDHEEAHLIFSESRPKNEEEFQKLKKIYDKAYSKLIKACKDWEDEQNE